MVPDGRWNVDANFSGEDETRLGSELPVISGRGGRPGGQALPAARERLCPQRSKSVK